MKFQKEKKLFLKFIILFLLFPVYVQAFDSKEIDKLLNKTSHLDRNNKLYEYSKFFLNVPYVPNVLIGSENTEEKFIIDLKSLDCFTYIEYVMALEKSSNYLAFKNNVKNLRYENGEVSFKTRNHFFTEWIANNNYIPKKKYDTKKSKILNKKNKDEKYLNGIPFKKIDIQYASIPYVNKIINSLNKNNFYIVGIISNDIGLDVSHVGFLFWNELGKATFRHASNKKKYMKVVDEDFIEYIQNKPGIIFFE